MKRHTSYAERLARGLPRGVRGQQGHRHRPPLPEQPRRRSRSSTASRRRPGITGFFVHNEGALPHVAAHLAEIDRRRDADLSIVALCPEDVARSVPELVDSIAVPAEAIGAAATDMIWEILTTDARPGVRLLPPVLSGGVLAAERVAASGCASIPRAGGSTASAPSSPSWR